MTPKLKRFIREELTCIKQDAEDGVREIASAEERLDCIKKHIATIEEEIAYEARSKARDLRKQETVSV